MLPIDLIGVGRSENAVGDKSGLNSVRMSHSVMRVAFPHPSFMGVRRCDELRRGASPGSIEACGRRGAPSVRETARYGAAA